MNTEMNQAPVNEASEKLRRKTWLSKGLETLVASHADRGNSATLGEVDFDVLIVGSGYGGAVAAAELAGCRNADGTRLRLCVLERGQEYLAGSFPSSMADLAGHARFVTPDATSVGGVRDGLFDVRVSPDMVTLVASGVGGGSLINAGVMAMPLPSVFKESRWPQAIRNDRTLAALGRKLQQRLDARAMSREPQKTTVMRNLSPTHQFNLAKITVAHRSRANNSHVILDKCIACGDCATGCNHNAKASLDVNLLRCAQHAGAKIYTGASVLRLEKSESHSNHWVIVVNHTNGHLRDRQPTPFRVTAKRVILAAGTLGSTEILMRSQTSDLRFSTTLGESFSGNGDMIASALDLLYPVNAVANEQIEPHARKVGPTITSTVDWRTDDPQTSLVVQDLAVPGPLRRLFEEAFTTADVLRGLVRGDCSIHLGKPDRPDEAQVSPATMTHSLVVALIGRDDASGKLVFGKSAKDVDADGMLTVQWPELRADKRFAQHHLRLQAALKAAGLGGRVIDNPLWRPLSEKMERVFGQQRGPLVSVHPLGGCAMADSSSLGVTDDLGRVYDAAQHTASASPVTTHEGLVVLDGAVIPTSLGINPALTISVLALRAITQLKVAWGVREPEQSLPKPPQVRRPEFRQIKTITAPKPTEIEVTEQMRGEVLLRLESGEKVTRWVEITLTTNPTRLDTLIGRVDGLPPGQLVINAANGRLRILKQLPNRVSDTSLPKEVESEYKLSGTIQLFALEPSSPLCRTVKGVSAWFVNRGLRDMAQSCRKPEKNQPSKWSLIIDTLRLTSRAGAVRLLEYDLKVGDRVNAPSNANSTALAAEDLRILGVKRLTYARASSPWTQLMELELKKFPGLVPTPRATPKLMLNPRYLAQVQVPLIRVVGQQDRVAALVDVTSFVLYIARVVLQIHAYSLRKPDAPSERPAQRLAGEVPGLPMPDITWLPVKSSNGPDVRIRLARYFNPAKAEALKTKANPPVLVIHGYSASSTTYAHPALPNGLARTLCDAGRDVWLLDMRSSAGMPTARGNWAFEEMANYDIPAAVAHVLEVTGKPKSDVIAHCMGAAMFSMAVLALKDPQLDPPNNWNHLYQKIGRVVLSQVGPALVLSPANVLRAYVMRYIQYFLPLEDYVFSPEGDTSVIASLMDRVLATLPLDRPEFDRENPFWPPGQFTPWVGTRHRIDALYAKTFSLMNLSDDVLAHIDDFFGPLSVQTVSQVIHFAQPHVVTDRTGFNQYLVPKRVEKRFIFPILSIHGDENGLSDVATLELMRDAMVGAYLPYLNDKKGQPDPTQVAQTSGEICALIDDKKDDLNQGKGCYMTWRIAGLGHQDCLIGQHAAEVSAVMTEFLARKP